MIVRDSQGNARIVPTPVDPFGEHDSPAAPVDPKSETLNDLSTLLGLISTIAYLLG